MEQITHCAVEAPLIDPLWLRENTHARFAALRKEHPVIRVSDQSYYVLRAEDVVPLLKGDQTVQLEGRDFAAVNQIPEGAMTRFLSDIFLLANGADHRARRGPFARAFAHQTILASRDRISAVARAIVSELPRGQSFDFLTEMAARVPSEMIAAMIGLPVSDAAYFAPRIYEMARVIGTYYPKDDHDRIETATQEVFTYIADQMKSRLASPTDDLLSRLVKDWEQDRGIDFDSLVHQVMIIMLGGSDTTRAASAMMVAQLLQRPDDWAALQAVPSLIPGAVTESLRFEPSVGNVPRFTVSEMQIGGTRVPAGMLLNLSTMSAMRDPALYSQPDEFLIRRTDHPRLHLVFGHGPHRCIGELLARLEMEESLKALLDAVPDMKMEVAPEMVGFGGIRQITPMIVRIS